MLLLGSSSPLLVLVLLVPVLLVPVPLVLGRRIPCADDFHRFPSSVRVLDAIHRLAAWRGPGRVR